MGRQPGLQETDVRGFSLLEVVLALGLFAVAASILMGGMVQTLSWFQLAVQRQQAVGMMSGIDAVLSDSFRMAPFKTGEGRIGNAGNELIWLGVAALDGNRIRAADAPDGIAPDQQFYRIEVRLAEASIAPHGMKEEAAQLVEVTVLWPYRVPAGNAAGFREVELRLRQQLRYWSAIRR
jgi:prepilin-type N-terminal cleavage/methylation domain-containing protein